jgi:TolB protein
MARQIGNRVRWPLLGLAFVLVLLAFVCVFPTCKHRFLEPQDQNPSWAPDSKQVVFVCYRRQRTKEWDLDVPYLGPYSGLDTHRLLEICTSAIDGSNRRQLTDNMVSDFGPSWSPDGSQIAFVSARGASEGTNIYVMQSDGTNPVNLTYCEAGYGQPRWSPDGQYIAFTSTRDNINGALYAVAPDGGPVMRLTDAGWTGSFDWSPDGRLVVFEAGATLDKEIFIVNVEDGSLVRMTANRVLDFEPVWSPDGRHIAFSSEREGRVQVYVMDIQTREEVRVSEDSSPSWGASWSPDAQFLAYVSGGRAGHNETLFVLDLEAETSAIFPDFQILDRPLWSPNGQYLIYERTEDWNGDKFGETKVRVLRVHDGQEWAVSSTKTD